MSNGGLRGGETGQHEEALMPMDLASMPPSSTEISDLVERLRTGRCVLCAGSRLTAADGDRSFRTLVDKLLAALPEADADGARRVLDSRPLAAAGYVRRRLGDRFADELKKAAAPFAELPEAVRLLGELPFRAVVTTAYDDAFERAFTKDGVVPRIYTPRDAEALKNDGKVRFVFKALGDPSRADSIVWSAEDLQSALADGGYRTVAHDLYRSRSFLFVGFDGQDPDLAMLLERVLAGARTGEVDHFAVMPGLGAVEKEELYAAYRIRVLTAQNVAELARQLKEAVGDEIGAGAARRRRLRGLARRSSPRSRRAPMRRAARRLTIGWTRSPKKLRRARPTGRSWSTSCSGASASSRRRSGAPRCCSTSPASSSTRSAICRRRSPRSSPPTRSIRGRRHDAWNELERLAQATGMWTRAPLGAGRGDADPARRRARAGVAAHRAAVRRQAQRTPSTR